MLSAARAPSRTLAAAGRVNDAADVAERWRNKIGDGYRIEVFDHRGYGHRALRDRCCALRRRPDTPVATNPSLRGPQDPARTSSSTRSRRSSPCRGHRHPETSEYYSSRHARCRRFADFPRHRRDRRSPTRATSISTSAPITSERPDAARRDAHRAPRRRCFDGAGRRYGKVPREVDDRLQHELQLIFRMGFAAYFILVADIVDHAKRVLGVRCSCRGSAAGSLVCYVLGISDVDPIRYDLLFERFMNARREELPDIDVDFESARREEVLHYILKTYGSEQTAICCMVDTFRARMAIREVGKALGLPPEEIDLVAKAFPRVRARDIPQAIERLPELAGSNLAAGQLEQLFELCIAIAASLATSPCTVGGVLSSPDLATASRCRSRSALHRCSSRQGRRRGARSREARSSASACCPRSRHASDEIVRIHGTKIDLDEIARDDTKTFDLVKSSRTLGASRSSRPDRRAPRTLHPSRFEDRLSTLAVRPGP